MAMLASLKAFLESTFVDFAHQKVVIVGFTALHLVPSASDQKRATKTM